MNIHLHLSCDNWLRTLPPFPTCGSVPHKSHCFLTWLPTLTQYLDSFPRPVFSGLFSVGSLTHVRLCESSAALHWIVLAHSPSSSSRKEHYISYSDVTEQRGQESPASSEPRSYRWLQCQSRASCKPAPTTPRNAGTPANSSQKEVWNSDLSIATGHLYYISETLLEMMQVIFKYFSQKISLLYSGAY